MNTYEITFIVRPDLDEDQTRAVVDGVTNRVTGGGGEILATVPWNPSRRRMAYPIRDFGDGFYVTCVFRQDPQSLRAIENQLRLNESILRLLIVQATEQMVKQAQQRVQQAAARTAPEPVAASTQEPAPSAPEPVPTSTQEPAPTTPTGPQEPVVVTESTPIEPSAAEATPEPVPVSVGEAPAQTPEE